jgi:Protein of unknown function/AsmA-like C-terminal region
VIRPASKLVLKFLLATAISALLLVALLGVKLLSGPVSLTLLQPVVEAVLNDVMTQYRVSLGETEIAWSRSAQRLDLKVKMARLKTLDGQVLAVVPEMAVGFSPRALAHGRLVPGTVELIGPSATLVRRADGGVQFGFSAPTGEVAEGSTGFFSKLVAGLRAGPDGSARLGYLNRFTIKDANLFLHDALTHSDFHAPHALVAFTRSRSGLEARLAGAVETGKGRFSVTGSAMLPHRGDDTTVTLSLAGLDPSMLAASADSPFAALKGVQIPLRGDATFEVDGEGRVKTGAFWLFAGAGPFAVPGLPSIALELASAEVKGTYNAARSEIVLERLSYKGRGNSGLVTGKAVLDRSQSGAVTAARFDLTAQDVLLDMPALFSEAGKIERVAMSGRIDPSAMHLSLTKAELRAGDAILKVTGELQDHPEGLGLSLDGTIEHFAIAQFAKLWPLGPGQGARDWILANIPEGMIRSGVLKVDAQPGELAQDPLPEKAVQLTFAFDGMTIDYLHGLTPITKGEGHATLTGNRFNLVMDKGAVGSLALSEGRFVVPDLSNREVPASIAARLKGSTSDLLAVLDMDPLYYPSSYGFDPQDVGGVSDAQIALSLPMKRSVHFAEIGLKADLEAADFTLPHLYREIGIEGGTVKAAITNDRLRASGKLVVAGEPATVAWSEDFLARNKPSTHLKLEAVLDDKARAAAVLPFAQDLHGPTPLSLTLEGHGKDVSKVAIDCNLGPAAVAIDDLNWTKRKGAPATGHLVLRFPQDGRVLIQDIALEGSGLDIKGTAALAPDGSLESASLNPLKAGTGTNARLQFASEGKSRRSISIEGESLDLSKAVKGLTDELKSGKPDTSHAPIRLSANLHRLELAHGVVLADLEGHYATPGHGIGELSLKAAYAGGGFISARVEKDGAKRWLRLRSADTGKLLAGLDLTDTVDGGSLILDASLPPAGPTPIAEAVTGTASLKGFRVKQAPVLAKLLTVASFGGIRDLLTGEGIAFESLDMPFSVTDRRIVLGPGKAFGPSIGLTVQGDVVRGSGNLDLSGTLVPAYALNTFLGNVPVIGNIFVSREGEGVIGMTYAVNGDAGDPHVMVNPLSALAPGFLRRIFQLDESNAADRTGAVPVKPVDPE